MQFMRRTGLQPITLGFNGNCKMQPYFADVLEQVEADAYVFDPFSNPNIPMIKERLRPFIERMVKAHPGKMLETLPEPRPELKPQVPRIVQIEIPKEFIGAVIGPGGKIIQQMQEDTGATITIEETDGERSR